MSDLRQPVSWLRLERYALGELSGEEQRAVERALSEDPMSQQCLRQLQQDLRQLPPLPTVAPVVSVHKHPWWWSWRMLLAGAAMVALLWFLPREPTLLQPPDAATGAGAKGDAVALELVRERQGTITFAPEDFAAEDRFKVRVTCGAPGIHTVDVVVYQAGEASMPLATESIQCGNLVTLTGAFRLTGSEEAEVCVVLGRDHAPGRSLATREQLPSDAPCVTLYPRD